MLQQNVIADGVYERSQAVGLKNLAVAQGHKKTGKGFLTDILDGFRRLQAGAQLDFDQRAEVGGKMLLRAEVSGPQAAKVGVVKGLKLQVLAPHILKCQKV